MTEDLTGQVIDLLEARKTVVRSPEVREAAEIHILDTLAAVISGRVMPAGVAASRWLATRSATGRSTAAGHAGGWHPEDAAFANSMCAHADESDDSHEPSRSHPGAAIVPTVLAVAEHLGSTGEEVLDAVSIGYEACALMNWLGWATKKERQQATVSTHALGSLWGAAVGAAALHGFDRDQMRPLISYTVQMAGGVTTWLRDEHHIEKAFAFCAMGANNGVRAAELVAAGWPGVRNPLDGSPSYFTAFNLTPDLSALERLAGNTPIVVETNIKKYCVGSPAQAAVQAAEELFADGVRAADVTAMRVCLPADIAFVVDQRDMEDINVQYLVSRTLIDGACTFAAAHDTGGGKKPEVAALLARTTLVADHEMELKRQARVEADLSDGRTVSRSVFPVRGTSDDPMTRHEVEVKADDLLGMGLGGDDRAALIDACRGLDAAGLATIARCLTATHDTGVYIH